MQSRLAALANRSDVENRSSRSDGRGSDEIQPRSEFPQVRTDNCAGADNQIANKIVRADHLAAPIGVTVSDDEGLARCISELFYPTDYKRDYQRRKTSSDQQ